MERELPADAAVLGVDEHTAVLIDLRAEDIEIRGRGGVTVRRSGDSVVLPSGTRLSVADLRDLVRGIRRAREGAGAGGEAGNADSDPARGDTGRGGGGLAAGGNADEPTQWSAQESALPLPEVMAAAERGFGAAAGARDADAMVGVILELETAITQWEADTDEDQGTEQARALLRSLIGRLGRRPGTGWPTPGTGCGRRSSRCSRCGPPCAARATSPPPTPSGKRWPPPGSTSATRRRAPAGGRPRRSDRRTADQGITSCSCCRLASARRAGAHYPVGTPGLAARGPAVPGHVDRGR